MRRYGMLINGLAMVGAAMYLILRSPQELPLWFIWLAGAFLWYIGIATSITGAAITLFLPLSARQHETRKKKQEQV